MVNIDKRLIHHGEKGVRTLITNFSPSDMVIIARAIIEFEKTNEEGLIISPFAYDVFEIHIPTLVSLHDLLDRDLSLFWRIVESIRNEPTRA